MIIRTGRRQGAHVDVDDGVSDVGVDLVRDVRNDTVDSSSSTTECTEERRVLHTPRQFMLRGRSTGD